MSLPDTTPLFRPFRCGTLSLANRTVMAPMTRCLSPGGVPGPEVAAYYRRRAEGGVGLIVTEGTWIDHPTASNEDNAPRFHGDDALTGWRHVVDEVHAAGGRIVPQLWHVGLTVKPDIKNLYTADGDVSHRSSPSGYWKEADPIGRPATESEIADLIAAYANGAAAACAYGFDGVEVHGAHGYLIDQFFWHATNRRDDGWGGATLAARAGFGVEVVRAMRRAVGPDFPILFRFSQWKQHDYAAKLATAPDELAALLEPLADAGVNIFHASQRRFWEAEFAGSDLNLAGWAQKLSGRPAIAVGSVGLDREFLDTMFSAGTTARDHTRLDALMRMLENGDFDLVAIGRALLADPNWVDKLYRGEGDEGFVPFTPAALATLS